MGPPHCELEGWGPFPLGYGLVGLNDSLTVIQAILEGRL